MSYKSIFQSYLDATNSADSPAMRLQRQREEMRERMFEQQEYQKLVKDVGDYVLRNLNLTVDTGKAIEELKELNDTIERLGE